MTYFGFVTIPLMALAAFILISGIMALTKWADDTGTGTDNSVLKFGNKMMEEEV